MGLLQSNKLEAPLQKGISKGSIMKLLFKSYIVTMPFISAFAISGTLNIPLLIAVAITGAAFFQTLTTGKLPVDYLGADIVIALTFLFVVFLSYLSNGTGNSTSLNHTVAYTATIVIFYLGIKYAMFSFEDKQASFNTILKLVSFVALFCSAFAVIEFVSNNFFDNDLTRFIPRPGEKDKEYYRPLVLRLFYRARAFSPEPGHHAFMIELFSPITIYYLYFSGLCLWKNIYKIFCIILITVGVIFTASTAAFIIFPAAFIITCVLFSDKVIAYVKRQGSKFYSGLAITTLVVVAINILLPIYDLIILSIMDKQINGADYREENMQFFIDKFFKLDITQQLVGAGPAGVVIMGYDESTAILNLYYSVYFETGILGIILLALFFLYSVYNAVTTRNRLGFCLTMALVAGLMHYVFIANYYYPWFWFVAAFAVFSNKKYQKKLNEIQHLP